MEGLALLQCVSECRASAKLMQHPAALAIAWQLAAASTEADVLRVLLRVRMSLTKVRFGVCGSSRQAFVCRGAVPLCPEQSEERRLSRLLLFSWC